MAARLSLNPPTFSLSYRALWHNETLRALHYTANTMAPRARAANKKSTAKAEKEAKAKAKEAKEAKEAKAAEEAEETKNAKAAAQDLEDSEVVAGSSKVRQDQRRVFECCV